MCGTNDEHQLYQHLLFVTSVSGNRELGEVFDNAQILSKLPDFLTVSSCYVIPNLYIQQSNIWYNIVFIEHMMSVKLMFNLWAK